MTISIEDFETEAYKLGICISDKDMIFLLKNMVDKQKQVKYLDVLKDLAVGTNDSN